MSERKLHIADEYDLFCEAAMKDLQLQTDRLLNAPFPQNPNWESDNNPVNNTKINYWSEVRENLRLGTRGLFMVPDGEDGVQQLLATYTGTKEILGNGAHLVKTVADSFSDQLNLRENSKKAVAAAAAVGVLATGITANAINDSEESKGANSELPAISITRNAEYASVSFPMEDQDINSSIIDAANASRILPEYIEIKDGEIRFIDEAKDASPEEIMLATMAALKPEVVVDNKSESTELNTIEEQNKLPKTPEEKFNAEKLAIENAIKHAAETGDVGPLNHMVAFSPIFQPRYDLPGDLEKGTIRSMPPSNLLDIPGLIYEFSKGAPDKERLATSPVISTALVTAYKFRRLIETNPEYAEKFADSCIRMGDLSAKNDHKSHFGSQIDITSALKCNITDGRSQADGPVFWINHTSGGIDTNITNPNHVQELDNAMLSFVTSLNINGDTVVKNILYSKPNSPDRVQPHANHSNHIHINGKPPVKDLELKDFANGGERPEVDLTKLRGQIFVDYEAGKGIDGISKSPENVAPKELQVSEGAKKYFEQFRTRIEELKPIYLEIEKQTGVPWQFMAALHYREGGNRPDASMFAGEKIGSVNPDNDTVVGTSLLENGIKAAEHFKSNALKVYGVKITPDISDSDLMFAFLAYNRGNMYKNASKYIGRKMQPEESPYVMNGLVGFENMHWPNVGNYNKEIPKLSWGEPKSVHGKKNDQLGALTIIKILGYEFKKAANNESLPNQKPESANIKEKKLVLIGDSLTHGLDLVDIEKMEVPGVDVIAINARGGRSLAGEITDKNVDNGLVVLEELINSGEIQKSDFVYFAFGTNQLESDQKFEESLRASINKISEVSNATVVIPLIFSNVSRKDIRNEIIKRIGKETNSIVINPGEGVQLGDEGQIHPGPDGYRIMSLRILDAVTKAEIKKPQPKNSDKSETAQLDKKEAEVSTTTTTQVKPDIDSKNTEVINDLTIGWFSEEKARDIYKIWFEVKSEVDGEIVKSVDESKLKKWMSENVTSKKAKDGQRLYRIEYDNLPDFNNGGN